jgi:hypothetical protein
LGPIPNPQSPIPKTVILRQNFVYQEYTKFYLYKPNNLKHFSFIKICIFFILFKKFYLRNSESWV